MTKAIYLEPIGLVDPDIAGRTGLPFLGGPRRFIACRRFVRRASEDIEEVILSTAEVMDESDNWVDSGDRAIPNYLSQSRLPFAGVPIDRPVIMGVLNVTPDSFSDGGNFFDHGRAIEAGHAMVEAGATIIDVGGESTRPGAHEVDPDEELRRTRPVIQALAKAGIAVSTDTRHSVVMAAALDAGARIVNDISALTHDADSLSFAADSEAAIVLMHMRGTPENHHKGTPYTYAPLDIFDYLRDRVAECLDAGIPRDRLAVDPGIGFGKTVQENIDILHHLGLFHGLGCPVALGVSRKLHFGESSRRARPAERGSGTLAAVLAAADLGVQILRVHDVAETVQALEIRSAILDRLPQY